jgi:hypothetical protein
LEPFLFVAIGQVTIACQLLADTVAKRFLASERETLIQDQALTRNVDAQIHSHRFDCCVFQFYSLPAATFATISALSVISLLRSDSVAFGCEADMRTVDRTTKAT